MFPASLVIAMLIAVSILLCAIILCIAAEAQLQRRKKTPAKSFREHANQAIYITR